MVVVLLLLQKLMLLNRLHLKSRAFFHRGNNSKKSAKPEPEAVVVGGEVDLRGDDLKAGLFGAEWRLFSVCRRS